MAEIKVVDKGVSGKSRKTRNPKVEHVLDQTLLDGLDLLEVKNQNQTDKELKGKVAGRIAVNRFRVEARMAARFGKPKDDATLESLL